MKPFELAYLVAEPMLPALYCIVRRRLVSIARSAAGRCPDVLDVGGRKSHYTIGVPARITVTDLPRRTELQQRLNLGITEVMLSQMHARRSNIHQVILDDMTSSVLPDASFDCIVAVEVIEHVAEDEHFVREVHRVLRPGGRFLATTTNGEVIPNTNPDHKRHYTREQLWVVLSAYFETVDVHYGIRAGRWHRLGMRSWALGQPIQTLVAMAANIMNGLESVQPGVRDEADKTCHLVAEARKG
jgi:SAM-dependent methyltransferase